MAPRQSILSRDGNNTISIQQEDQLPSSSAAWNTIPSVGSGATSFKSKSEHASIITKYLKSGSIPLSVKPENVRCFFPFLHQYKRDSFRSWYYKVRAVVKPKPGENEEEDEELSLAKTATTPAIPRGTYLLIHWISGNCYLL